jgi:hypothetical protein
MQPVTCPMPELLQHLLEKGADADVQSIYGTVALHDACMNQNLEEIDILLKHGADPHICDNDGTSPYAFVQQFKRMLAVFDKYLKKPISKKVCSKCHSRIGNKRCGGCRVVFYCSKECQTSHWFEHKKACKLSQKSHKRLKISKQVEFESCFSDVREALLHNMQYAIPSNKPEPVVDLDVLLEHRKNWDKNGNLILKLQIRSSDSGSIFEPIEESGPILTYDEAKSIFCYLSKTELDGPAVVNLLIQNGIGKSKAYFYAYLEEDKPDEIVIITDPMLPAQPW